MKKEIKEIHEFVVYIIWKEKKKGWKEEGK